MTFAKRSISAHAHSTKCKNFSPNCTHPSLWTVFLWSCSAPDTTRKNKLLVLVFMSMSSLSFPNWLNVSCCCCHSTKNSCKVSLINLSWSLFAAPSPDSTSRKITENKCWCPFSKASLCAQFQMAWQTASTCVGLFGGPNEEGNKANQSTYETNDKTCKWSDSNSAGFICPRKTRWNWHPHVDWATISATHCLWPNNFSLVIAL